MKYDKLIEKSMLSTISHKYYFSITSFGTFRVSLNKRNFLKKTCSKTLHNVQT